MYRWLNDQVYALADLRAMFRDSPIFILGGSPTLALMPLARLETSRLPTLALNNVPYVYGRPTMWLTADKPSCFGGHFFARHDVLKFAYMNHKDELVAATGRTVKEHPQMHLYTAAEATCLEDIFSEEPAFTWWKSVFPIALQLCWRLGARRVYLVGCAFHNRVGTPYAWGAPITKEQADYSQRTYDGDASKLLRWKPMFEARGFELISCTPNSRANAFLPYMSLDEAIDRELAAMPQPTPMSSLVHSSEHLVRKQV